MNGNTTITIVEEISCWTRAPTVLSIDDEDVHVWLANLDRTDSVNQFLCEILSDDEIRKAKRFNFDRDRIRYILSHGILRKILSLYVNIPPQAIRFQTGENGKPALDINEGGCRVHFNIARSASYAIFAFSHYPYVGIDIEKVRSNFNHDQIVPEYFSSEEVEIYQKLPANFRQAAFYHGWTCKEAYLKATGDGLSQPLDQFTVSINPKDAARLISIYGDPQAALQWTLVGMIPAPGHVAALAVKGKIQEINYWMWVNQVDST